MLKRLMQCLAPWALADLAGPNSMSDNSNLADAARGSPSGNLASGSPTYGAQDSVTVRRE